MTDDKDGIAPGDAQQALDAIQQAERAGLSRAMPQRWFGAVIAVIIGALVAAAATGSSEYVALAILALPVAIALHQRKLGASAKPLPSTAMGYVALAGFVAFALAVIVAARILVEDHGLAWAPLAGGAVIATLAYVLSLLERRAYLAKIDGAADR